MVCSTRSSLFEDIRHPQSFSVRSPATCRREQLSQTSVEQKYLDYDRLPMAISLKPDPSLLCTGNPSNLYLLKVGVYGSRNRIPTTPQTKQNNSAQSCLSTPVQLLCKRPDQGGEPCFLPDNHEGIAWRNSHTDKVHPSQNCGFGVLLLQRGSGCSGRPIGNPA
jgi:hypothetical protein